MGGLRVRKRVHVCTYGCMRLCVPSPAGRPTSLSDSGIHPEFQVPPSHGWFAWDRQQLPHTELGDELKGQPYLRSQILFTLRDIKDTKEESCRERTRGHRELKCGQRGWGATEGCVRPGLGSGWPSPRPHILWALQPVTGKLGRGGYKASRGGGTLKLLGCGFGEIFF